VLVQIKIFVPSNEALINQRWTPLGFNLKKKTKTLYFIFSYGLKKIIKKKKKKKKKKKNLFLTFPIHLLKFATSRRPPQH
jgi:hypothetical protein